VYRLEQPETLAVMPRLLDAWHLRSDSDGLMKVRQRATRMTTTDRAQMLSRLIDAFERRGWREDGHTALELVRLFDEERAPLGADRVARVLSSRFLAQNHTNPTEVADAVQEVIPK
jgi:hypothetical protein